MNKTAVTALVVNLAVAVLGVLQATNWVNIGVGEAAGTVTAIVAGANTVLHALAPLLKAPTV